MKRLRRYFAFAAASALIASAFAAADDAAPAKPLLIVWAGTLLAVPGQPPLRDQSIVIRGGVVERVVPGFLTAPPGAPDAVAAQTLDLSRSFVLPGLIDLHVHLTTEPTAASMLDGEVQRGEADLALLAAVHARRTLAAGFTTVLDMGTGRLAHEHAIYAVRDAIAAGVVDGPQILAVGSPLSAPGSSRTQRYKTDVERAIAPQGVCSGADDCRRAVREQVARGADVVSFYNSGSLLAHNSPAQTFTDEEMQAIVATAHALHRPVIADGGNSRVSAAGINAALRAGVDAIDTATFPDAETWRLLQRSGAYFVPHLYALTAAVGDTPATLTDGTMGWLPRPVLEQLYRLKQETPAAVEAARRGVPMALGSDTGVIRHGDNAQELVEYVRIGLSPAAAIATATVHAAAVLGLSQDRGTIEPGKRADLIAVDADPLQDIAALRHVAVVIKAGRVIKP